MPWPDMPKHLGKDNYFLELERLYSDANRARIALDRLRGRNVDPKTGARFDMLDMGSLDAAAGPAGQPAPSASVRRQHFAAHWFGRNSYSVMPPSTGWWINWRGDPEGVLQETLARALETAFGIGYNQAVPSGKQPAPISFFWVCGLPKFESYISWRTLPGKKLFGWTIAPPKRVVTVVLLTPGFIADPDHPEAGADVEDFPLPGPTAVSNYIDKNPNTGMIWVGQNMKSPSPEEPTTLFADMEPGVVVDFMDWTRGGIG